jgi:hypothetical protein
MLGKKWNNGEKWKVVLQKFGSISMWLALPHNIQDAQPNSDCLYRFSMSYPKI